MIVDPTKGAEQKSISREQLNQIIANLSKVSFKKEYLDGFQITAGLKWEKAIKSNDPEDLFVAHCYLRLSMAKASQLVEVVWENKLNEAVKKFGFTKAEILEKFKQKLSDEIQEIYSKISY